MGEFRIGLTGVFFNDSPKLAAVIMQFLRNFVDCSSGIVLLDELLHDVRQDVEDFEMGAAAEKVETLIDAMKKS